MNVLYISYDGASENLGQSQIIPYILALSKKKLHFTILTYEKKISLENHALISSINDNLRESNIDWIYLKYHKSPPIFSTVYDLLRGVIAATGLIIKKKIKIIHGRSFIGSVIALILKGIFNVKVIFDIRGFFSEERVESGQFDKNGIFYRVVKGIEKMLLLKSDEIVILTKEGKNIIESEVIKEKDVNITVIPTCVDINRFNRIKDWSLENNLNLNGKFLITYIGSLSTWYMHKEMFRFFEVSQKLIGNSHFMILTKETKFLHDKIQNSIKNISIIDVKHALVPRYLTISKVGIAFYKPGFSRKACSPTKLGEYLACGLPVIINSGIGDCDDIILKERVGVIINEFSSKEYERAIKELMKLLDEGDVLKKRCRETAEKYFSLEMGVERYRDVYSRLLRG